MQADRHDSMRHLIDQSLAGDVSPQQQQSLRGHLLTCAECRKYADESSRAIAGLRGFSFGADPGLQAKVLASLAQRAQQLEAAQPGRRRIARISILALVFTILGSVGALHLGAPLAALLHLQPAQTQAGLLTFWVAPSWCFSLLLPVLLLVSARSANRKGHTL